jgi:uncharacterized protein
MAVALVILFSLTVVFIAVYLDSLSETDRRSVSSVESGQGGGTVKAEPAGGRGPDVPETKPNELPAPTKARPVVVPAAPVRVPKVAVRVVPGGGSVPKTGKTRRVAVIIDDVGYNLKVLEPFLRLGIPLTFAVLPGVPYTGDALALIRAAGKEAMLHQPMEAEGGSDPGPGAIGVGMSPEEVRSMLAANLAAEPGVVAVNNHEGSLVTADPVIMKEVLDYLTEKGLFYVDSMTTGHSAVEAVALSARIPILERDVFLDNLPDRDSIVRYVQDGLRVADRKGHAIMIGHVWSTDLAKTLSDLYPQMIADGYSLSTISEMMMDETSDADPRN